MANFLAVCAAFSFGVGIERAGTVYGLGTGGPFWVWIAFSILLFVAACVLNRRVPT